MSRDIELSRRKVLAGLGVVGGASAGAGLGATALLGDEEAFSNNRLVAGTLDLRAAWQTHYADGRGGETTYARRPGPDEQPAFRLPAGGSTERSIARVFEDPPGDDGGTDSRPGEDDGGRQFLRNTRRGQVNGGVYAGPDLCDPGVDVPAGAVIDLADVKPGDFGFVLFRLRLCDNPGYLWLTGALEAAAESGVTEPESGSPREDGDPDSTDPADVELLDAIQVAYGVGTTDDLSATDPAANLLPDPDPDSEVPQPATQTSLRGFLGRAGGGAGIPLVGDIPASEAGGAGRNCFSSGADHYVSVVWWVPPDRGNEIQSDEVTFDLGFYAEQCRNNDGTDVLAREARLLATDPAGGAYFGADATIDGDRIAVTADGRNLNGTDSGAVYAFERSGGTWNGTGPIGPADGESGDLFGESVAVDGDRIVVGATGDAENGTDAGAAYVFDHDGGGWSETAKLTPTDAAAGDSFGQDVAVSGGRVLVGADGESSRGTEAGAAYVFERDGGGWSQAAKLLPADGEAEDYFGSRVALDDGGTTAVVGAYGDAENGSNAGAAYVFDHDGGGWSETAKLTPSAGSAGDFFGSSVSIDGATVLVGAFGDDGGGAYAGAAYAFTREGGTWTEQGRLESPTPSAGAFFGWAVALDGNRALVGEYGANGAGDEAGTAHAFSRDGTDWNWTTRVASAGVEGGDRFGVALDADGGTAVVTADGDDEEGSNTGTAYVFDGGGQDD